MVQALVCVCPLLGVSYLLTLYPVPTPKYQHILNALRDFILSFQVDNSASKSSIRRFIITEKALLALLVGLSPG